MTATVAIFGESERGDFRTAYFCQSVQQLHDKLGLSPKLSKGMDVAVQALLLGHNVIYFRVQEEGFGIEDYLLGLRFLENKELIVSLSAIGIPGVGDECIVEEGAAVCQIHGALLIVAESDLYDYMTFRKN